MIFRLLQYNDNNNAKPLQQANQCPLCAYAYVHSRNEL